TMSVRGHLHGVHVIEASRAGNMRAVVPVAVTDEDHAHLRVVQVRLQPDRRDDRLDARSGDQGKYVQHAELLRSIDGERAAQVSYFAVAPAVYDAADMLPAASVSLEFEHH